MAEYWHTEREARASALGRPGFTVLRHDRSGTGERGFFYAHSHILMTDDARLALDATMGTSEFVRLKEESDGLRELGLQLYAWAQADVTRPEQLPDLVISLQDTARANDPHGRCHVSLNYVLTGEKTTIPHGGAVHPPIPAAAVATPAFNADLPFLAVIDTGIATGTVTGQTGAVIASGADEDLLLAPVAGGGSTDLGAEAGHGTFIAWLVAKMAGGGVGVAALKVLDADGFGTIDDVVEALRRLRVDLPRQHSFPMGGASVGVVNMSLGGYTDDSDALAPEERDAMPLGLRDAFARWFEAVPDSVVVAAAGNDGLSDRPFWPAAESISNPQIIAVGSLDAGLEPSEFSNRGDWVTVSTLGEEIHSDYPVGTYPVAPGVHESLAGGASWSGTSFATPIVAAEIAARALRTQVPALHAWRNDLLPELAARPAVPGLGFVWDPRSKGAAFDPRI